MTGLRRFTNLLLIVAFTAGCAISRAPGSRVFDIRLSADQIVVQQVPHGLFVASPVVHTQHLKGRRRPTVWWLSIKRQDTSARQFRRQSLGRTHHHMDAKHRARIAIGDEQPGHTASDSGIRSFRAMLFQWYTRHLLAPTDQGCHQQVISSPCQTRTHSTVLGHTIACNVHTSRPPQPLRPLFQGI